MTNKQLDRFFDKISADASGCWIWTRQSRDGYGRIFIDSRPRLAHRVSYEHFIGDIPRDMELDHLCRNTVCVNPTHLEAVSHLENVRRGALGVLRSPSLNEHLSRIRTGKPRAWTPEWRAKIQVARDKHSQLARERTHCRRGHAWNEANTIRYSNGSRQCRTCLQAAQARWRGRRKASAA